MTLAAIANAAIIWIAYRFADRLTAAMGATARQVVVRLSAFLLMCIGVQILVTAVGDLVVEWRPGSREPSEGVVSRWPLSLARTAFRPPLRFGRRDAAPPGYRAAFSAG